LGEKRDDVINEIGDINSNIDNVIVTFEKETGTRDMKMWS